MAKSLAELCVPRPTVFDPTIRDVVLDLTDLLQDQIEAAAFFAENYPTDGMPQLLRLAFARFERRTDSPGVFVLTQAVWEAAAEEATAGRNWLHAEVPGYWNHRQALAHILLYMAAAAPTSRPGTAMRRRLGWSPARSRTTRCRRHCEHER